jgi:hypothetical protein
MIAMGTGKWLKGPVSWYDISPSDTNRDNKRKN